MRGAEFYKLHLKFYYEYGLGFSQERENSVGRGVKIPVLSKTGPLVALTYTHTYN